MYITDVALPSGYGVARLGDLVVFVPGAVTGDRVRARIAKFDKRFGYGELVWIEEPSSYREVARCARFAECGGCDIQTLTYEKQLEIKQNHLTQVLRRIGGIDPAEIPVSNIVPSVDRFFYRSKIEFSFGQAGGEVLVGLSERTSALRPSAGRIVPVDDCALFSPVAGKILPLVRDFVRESGLKAYDPVTGKGTLRRLVLREAKQTGEVMINIIAESDIADRLGGLARSLAESVPEVRSFYATSSNRARLVSGRSYIDEILSGLTLRVYPLSFFQPNPRTAERLCERIIPVSRIRGDETVLGLYSGAGSIELFLSRHVKEVRGVDWSRESISCAKENAAINRSQNCLFIRDRVEGAVHHHRAKGIDLVVIDPPRSGMSKEAISAIRQLKAARVVYISCNPSTLARDLKGLRRDYAPKEIIPFDFFPHTGHFEVLTLLERG